jgi:hypothetical protein
MAFTGKPIVIEIWKLADSQNVRVKYIYNVMLPTGIAGPD